MAMKIRLARAGTKKRPYYHIVVADHAAPRDGKFIDVIGAFNPMLGKLMGGKGAPDAAELEKMQAELAALDPNAIPADLKGMMSGGSLPEMSKSLPGLGGGGLPGLGGLGGLPGLGGKTPPFKGFPGLPGKKR